MNVFHSSPNANGVAGKDILRPAPLSWGLLPSILTNIPLVTARPWPRASGKPCPSSDAPVPAHREVGATRDEPGDNPSCTSGASSRASAGDCCHGRKKWRRWIGVIVLTLSLFVIHCDSAGQDIDVLAGHWAYDFLDHLETRGLAAGVISNTRPLSRAEIRKILTRLVQQKNPALTPAERDRLARLLFEFADLREHSFRLPLVSREAQHTRRRLARWLDWLPVSLFSNGRNVYAYSDGRRGVTLDPIFRRDGAVNRADSAAYRGWTHAMSWGYRLTGAWGGFVSFFLDTRDTREWGENYPEVTGHRLTWPRYGYAERRGRTIWHDETIAYLRFAADGLRLTLGKFANRWGPGRSGALALNDFATSYDQIHLQVQFWRLKFAFLHATLQQYPPLARDGYVANGVTRRHFADKYLAAHRLEISPASTIRIGLHETVIYGERGMELSYLNPVMFYRSAEHFLGDRDNVTLGFDCVWRLRHGLQWYGEMLFDDFSLAKVGTNWYGNKIAWLSGIFLAGWPLGRNWDWRAELVHIDPYVYTHTFPINVYKHYNTNLGHPAGPNSRVLLLQGMYWHSRCWRFTATWQQRWHGANTPEMNYGGNIDRAFNVHDPKSAPFLAGVRELETLFQLQAQYDIFQNIALQMGVSWRRFRQGNERPEFSAGGFLALTMNYFASE